MKNEKLEAQIDEVLAQQRDVAVPTDFSRRVMEALPPRRPQRGRVPVGRVVALTGALLLLAAMFALAPAARPDVRNAAFDMELLLALQLLCISWMASSALWGKK